MDMFDNTNNNLVTKRSKQMNNSTAKDPVAAEEN